MRRKGPIWGENYQKLIVESYKSGKFISDIMKQPEIVQFSPSEYTIRSILKANKVRATWKKKKRQPKFWRQDVVDKVISLRNFGKSIRSTRDEVNACFPEIEISKSTVVRMLKVYSGKVRFRPSRRRDVWKPDIARRIVELYRQGMLINDIREVDFLKELKPSGNVIREVLKTQGVRLTWKKGQLRRWPENVRKRIVEMYRSGMNFNDILQNSELQHYKPTHYAIRKILKQYGVKTKGETRYKQPISDERFHAYRNGNLSPKEQAIIHKHLAVNETGREKMIKRMRLHLVEKLPEAGDFSDKIKALKVNAKRLRDFFTWSMINLSDEATKKSIIMNGLEFGRRLANLNTAFRRSDEVKLKQAWSRVVESGLELSELYNRVLSEPSQSFRMEPID
jgi:hypothetical protein